MPESDSSVADPYYGRSGHKNMVICFLYGANFACGPYFCVQVAILLCSFYQSQAAPRIFASDSKAFLSSSSKAEVIVESMSITATICLLSAHNFKDSRVLNRSMAKSNI